jgi:hypothetical protein
MNVVPQKLPIPKLSQRLGQEAGRPHPVLDRGEEMLDRLTLHAHFLRIADREVVAPPRPRAHAPIAMRRSGPVVDLSGHWNIHWV